MRQAIGERHTDEIEPAVANGSPVAQTVTREAEPGLNGNAGGLEGRQGKRFALPTSILFRGNEVID